MKLITERLYLYHKFLTAWKIAKAFERKKDAWLLNSKEEYLMIRYSIFRDTAYVMKTNDIMKVSSNELNRTQKFIELKKVLIQMSISEYKELTGKNEDILKMEKLMCMSFNY